MNDSERDYVLEHMASLADTLHKECLELGELIEDSWDAETVSKRVGRYEDEGDEIYHELVFYVRDMGIYNDHETGDLMRIVTDIEDLSDLIDDLAKNFFRYNVTTIRDNATVSIINCTAAASMLCELVVSLRKSRDKINRLFKDALELDHYKVEAGKIYDRQLNKLFTNETDPVEIIKWQNIYRSFMDVFEGFEKVSESFARYIVNAE